MSSGLNTDVDRVWNEESSKETIMSNKVNFLSSDYLHKSWSESRDGDY